MAEQTVSENTEKKSLSFIEQIVVNDLAEGNPEGIQKRKENNKVCNGKIRKLINNVN